MPELRVVWMIVVLGSVFVPAHAQVRYQEIDLGTLGGANSYAEGINDRGEVVGFSEIGQLGSNGQPIVHAFLYTNGRMLDLGTTGNNSVSYGINDSGQVVGWAEHGGDRSPRAFVYANGVMRDITDQAVEGRSINGSGQVAGAIQPGIPGFPSNLHAALFSGGTTRDLAPASFYSEAFGINSAGHVVGDMVLDSAFTVRHAFVFEDGTLTDIGTLGGAGSTDTSAALAINDLGQIVGWSAPASGTGRRAFLYSHGNMTDLDPNGVNGGEAHGINNLGQVVGSGYSMGGFLYADGQIVRLDSVVEPAAQFWSVYDTAGINDSGQIAADGSNESGHHALLLTPIPEPSGSVLLMATPLLRRRRSMRPGLPGAHQGGW